MCRNVTTLNDGWRNAVVLITLAAQSEPTINQQKRQDNSKGARVRPRQLANKQTFHERCYHLQLGNIREGSPYKVCERGFTQSCTRRRITDYCAVNRGYRQPSRYVNSWARRRCANKTNTTMFGEAQCLAQSLFRLSLTVSDQQFQLQKTCLSLKY